MKEINDHLRDICINLIQYFSKKDKEFYEEIIHKLDWCIGSYNNDQNAVGLVKWGEKSDELLISLLQNDEDSEGWNLKNDLRSTLDNYNDMNIS
jgi:hypothetical protein